MTATLTPAELLVAARDRISDESHWCVGNFAQDVDGQPTAFLLGSAVRWCALGALMVEADSRDILNWVEAIARDWLNSAVRELYPHRKHIDLVNDTEGHEATMRCFARAIELARTEATP